jgi:hypothetical protein
VLLQYVSDADLAHLVERHLAKVEVASSSLVIRSIALYYLFHCKAHKERSCVLYFFADAENGRIQIRLRSTETA